ncbi:MAG: tryptophanyl-tRNA synthetase [Lentisphaerae bacterium ADurb.BinA184]|nr:MAG: tryptophanyl-tRNA synthetase [Lentisphaerae bacterium ADurb.BinA184]
MAMGWFELTKNAKGQFSFVLKAANSEVILRSETYEAKASAKNGIASVQANCGKDANYECKDSSDGKFYFNLKAPNGQIVGTSQMYASADTRANGIASVKANGATKTVKDATAEKKA